MPHPINGLTDLQINPVLKASTPAATVATALYVVPGLPMDAQGNVRICNASGGDQEFSIGWTTQNQTSVTYYEYNTTIAAGCSLDLFLEDKWFPATTTLFVSSTGGGVSFTYQGTEMLSQRTTGQFTGS